MGVFKHDGLVVERGVPRDHIPVNKATHIVIYQVKIIALPRIIPQTEVPDEFIFGVYILDEYTGRELGAEHDLCLHVDRMDIEKVI